MSTRSWSLSAIALACASALPGCASDNALVLAELEREEASLRSTHALLGARAEVFHDSVVALCAAAPAPAEGGWVYPRDAGAIKAMSASWQDARLALDGLEGVLPVLPAAPARDLDGRYEQALEPGPDPDPFDDRGFIGLQAVERVLWADRAPAAVVKVESSLAGYVPAAFPADAVQAKRFRAGLCARLEADASALESVIASLSLDPKSAYAIVDRLADGQIAMLLDAGEGRASSRYAGFALADLRERLAAANAVHGAFRPWLLTKPSGAEVDKELGDAFARLDKQYAALGTDALPYVPEGWSNTAFSDESLASPFGKLFAVVSNETNSGLDGSLTHAWHEAASLLGLGGD